MSRNAASSVPFGGLAVAVIRAELLSLIWRSASMNTAMNKAKENVIPFPPGEAQGNRCAGSMRRPVREKKKQTLEQSQGKKYMEKLEREQEMN